MDEENIDKFILDSRIESINPSVPRKILYTSDTGEDNITNHCKMPRGEILYYVNNEWMNYNATLNKCGLSKLKIILRIMLLIKSMGQQQKQGTKKI